ncbi:metallophosphoesterase family protein [Rhizobium sp. Root1220]|uniref:metallophosphoesterase family protein n=1 Tax=Rhizobium sp. Root1220 TaxID=1736432 RepID=UPI0006F85696|nr:metallophosphoesterase family protein [Rhizobium sp. Root1220]KQV66223.1 serine/threonine protein phosphatase [Rhizobium sp. Root1220]
MSHTFAIGDIHGCIEPLNRLLDRIDAYASGGTVVFLGDYVDRGPDSRAVVARLIAGSKSPGWRWLALKGNHEDMMVRASNGECDESWWLENGGAQTLQSYGSEIPEAHLHWARDLPLIHIDDYRIFVHAGVREGVYLEDQKPRDMMWTRVEPDHSGTYWGKHLCHGHTPSPKNPVTVGDRTNIDSACVFGGKLSCAVFDDSVPGGPIEFLEVRA